MKVTSTIPAHKLNDVAAAARKLEEQGFNGTTTQENRHDAFLPLAVAATATTSLSLYTSIAIAFARSPMSSAMLAWDLQAASNGRFTLGLGSQVKGHNVRRFSVPWSAPAPRMREYVQAVRAIWDCWKQGGKLDYQGKHYQFSLMTPNFTPEPLTSELPKIQIAAVGPAMTKVAAEECDGIMLHPFTTRQYTQNVTLKRIQQGLLNSGRSRDQFEITGGGFVATGATDEDVAKMFEWVRTRIGFYGSTPSYWPVLVEHGLQDLGEKLNAMSKKGLWQDMTKEIADDVVHLFTAVGRHEHLKDAITARFKGMTDVVALPPETPRELIDEIKLI